jgi:hypothetical protein
MSEPLPCPWCEATDGFEADARYAGIGPGLEYPVMTHRCRACGEGVGLASGDDGQPATFRLTAFEPITEV